MGKRYEVTKTDKMIGNTEDRIGTGDELAAWDYATNVWRQADGTCRCTKCSGPLTAMLSSCVHALAVKRATSSAATDGVSAPADHEPLIAKALLHVEQRIGKSDEEVTGVMRDAMRELLRDALGVQNTRGGEHGAR